MRRKFLPLVLSILAISLSSCIIVDGNDDSYLYDESYGNFWAQNFYNNRFYRVDAEPEPFATGKHCTVWVEKGSGVSESKAKKIADEYDSNIYPKMMDAFCDNFTFEDDEGTIITKNTMELADWMVDGDGKLCILLLDIKDAYQGSGSTYTAGYFWAGNFFETGDIRHSNQRNMIYIDTYPGIAGEEESYRTIAHELQHLMNFVTSYFARCDDNGEYFDPMDTWVDEGLSSAAEWIYAGTHPEDDIKWFNSDPSELIRRGNNFFVWGNREKENSGAILDDYVTVYLFFQWLRLQAGTNEIYKDIITSPFYDYKAVTRAADFHMNGNGYSDWGTLLKTWLAANYINAPNGQYGYMNDLSEPSLKDIKAKTVPSGIKTIRLAPGEGVYSITSNYFMPSSQINSTIKYAGLNKSTPALSDTKTYNGGALLTYNVNTLKYDNSPDLSPMDPGETTGIEASEDIAAANIFTDASRQAFSFKRPFAISAADMLRQNGHEKSFLSIDLSNYHKKILDE